MPEPGCCYQHYKGGKYIVLLLATCADTKEPMVVYRSLVDEKVYVREANQWNDLVTSPANPKIKVPRFEKVA